jgi:hypothetical protein
MSFGFGDLYQFRLASLSLLFNWCVFALIWNDAAFSNSKLTMASSFQVEAAAAAASRGMLIITSNTISCRRCHLLELSWLLALTWRRL